jgi:hypothetical protein
MFETAHEEREPQCVQWWTTASMADVAHFFSFSNITQYPMLVDSMAVLSLFVSGCLTPHICRTTWAARHQTMATETAVKECERWVEQRGPKLTVPCSGCGAPPSRLRLRQRKWSSVSPEGTHIAFHRGRCQPPQDSLRYSGAQGGHRVPGVGPDPWSMSA